MIMVQWSCKVPPEKLKIFLQFARERLKPFHESHGCKRLELFTPMDVQKRYFSYQVSQERNRYTEQLIFDDLKEFENFLKAVEKDPHSREILGSYEKEFNVSDCSFILLTREV